MIARKLFASLATGSGAPVYGSDFAGTVLLARWLSALWGIALVPLTWAWARRWSGTVALGAAAFVAGFPALVQASHFGTVEMALVTLVVAGLLASERLAERRSLGRTIVGGIVLGLAVSVKAPGVLVALPLLHAAWAEDRPRSLARVGWIAAVALALVFVLNPTLPERLLGGGPGHGGEHTTLLGNLRRAYSGDFRDWTLAYARDLPVWTELTRVLPYAMGIVPELAALCGLFIAIRRARTRGPEARLLLFLLPLLALVLPARVKTVRFLLPALPALAVLAAVALAAIFRGKRARTVAVAGVAVVTVLYGAAFTAVYAEKDSRVRAAEWLDENVDRLEIVVVEDPPGYGPPLGSPTREIRRRPLRYEILWRGFYTVHEKRDAGERRQHIEDVLERADYLVLSEGHRAEFLGAGELRPVERRFYEDLDRGRLPFEKVASFKSYPRLGPLVLNDDRAEVLLRVFDHPRIDIWKRIPREPSASGSGGAS